MGRRLITTTVTPASSYDLTDVTTTKDELQIPTGDITKDAWIGRAITQVSAAIGQYTNRVFQVESVQDAFYPSREVYPYASRDGAAPLQLSRWPIVQVTSATLTDTGGNVTSLTFGTDYLVDSIRGWLIRLNTATGMPAAWESMRTITVAYEAGFTTIPADVADAALRMITQRFQGRGRDPYLKSLTQPGLGDQTFWVGNLPGVSSGMPQEIMDLLDNYRIPVVG